VGKMLRIILGVLLAVVLAVVITLNVVNVVQHKGVEKELGILNLKIEKFVEKIKQLNEAAKKSHAAPVAPAPATDAAPAPKTTPAAPAHAAKDAAKK
jgi:ribosomal protein L12E/L44/L45/RPP1/RPP2